MSVKELTLTNSLNKELPAIYIGYLRDMTGECGFKESLEVCSIVAQMSTIPVVSMGIDGNVVKFTPSAEECWGWSAAEVLSDRIERLMPKSVGDQHQSYIDRYVKTGIKKVINATLRTEAIRKNGELFPINLAVREVPGNEYFNSIFIAFVEDLTAKDEDEIAIRVNKLLVATSTTPIIKIDTKGIILEMNNAACGLFGYEPASLEGENIKILVGVAHRSQHDGYLKSYLQTGVKKFLDQELVRTVYASHRDGEEMAVQVKIREVQLSLQPTQYVGYLDVDDCDQKYTAAKGKNDIIISLVDTPIIVINEKGLVVKMSEPAEAAFGFSQTELVGHSVKLIMPDEVAEVHDEKIEQYLTSRRRVMIGSKTDITAKAKSGYMFPAVITVHQIETEHGLYFVALLKAKD